LTFRSSGSHLPRGESRRLSPLFFIAGTNHGSLNNAYGRDGKIYGFPFQRSTPILYWNKDMFAAAGQKLGAAGLDPDRPPKNWDELVEYAKILTIREGNQTKQYGLIIPGGWNDWIFEAFSRQNGSQLIKEDGLTVTFDSPQNLEALKLWVKLTQELKVCPVLRPWNITPDDFIGGVTAMMYYSTGGMAKIRKTAQFNWGAAFQPAGKQYGTPVGGGGHAVGLYILPQSGHPQHPADKTGFAQAGVAGQL
jgi:sn-glycerol 3-phosphate transport system substrate-binding protein